MLRLLWILRKLFWGWGLGFWGWGGGRCAIRGVFGFGGGPLYFSKYLGTECSSFWGRERDKGLREGELRDFLLLRMLFVLVLCFLASVGCVLKLKNCGGVVVIFGIVGVLWGAFCFELRN